MAWEVKEDANKGSEREELAAEVLPIEKMELALSVNCFEKRKAWLYELSEHARHAIKEMAACCHRAEKISPGTFLLLIGARHPDGSFAEGADKSVEEFLENAEKFLNSNFVPMPAREASGTVPMNIGLWLGHLEENLNEAFLNSGREEEFREKQKRYHSLPPEEEKAELPKAA